VGGFLDRIGGFSRLQEGLDVLIFGDGLFEGLQSSDFFKLVISKVALQLLLVAFGAEIKVWALSAMVSYSTYLDIATIANVIMFQFAHVAVEQSSQDVIELSSLDQR